MVSRANLRTPNSIADLQLWDRDKAYVTADGDMSVMVGGVTEVQHSYGCWIVEVRDEIRRVRDEGDIFQFGWPDRNNATQLCTQVRLGQQTVINGQWLIWKFIYPPHVL